MFKKYYKAANDDVSPKRELIDKIFKTATSESDKKRTKIYPFIHKHSAVAAAVLVLIVSVSVYPQIKNYDKKLTSGETTNKKSIIEENTHDTALYTAQEGKLNEEKESKILDYSKNTAIKENLLSNEDGNEKISKNRMIAGEKSVENSVKEPANFEILPEALIEVSDEEVKEITLKLTERFGTADEETGNEYIFEIIGKAEFPQNNFYIVRWRWLVDYHSSLLTTIAVTEDTEKIYECVYEDEKLLWNDEKNLID